MAGQSLSRMADIARRAGVSRTAVSDAQSGHSGVAENTRKELLEIAAELGGAPGRVREPGSRAHEEQDL
ncbi:LacI family DNA-binding transcriptional regulator [Kribbella sp. NPDC048915]|uniref:LacI family DNA-binding transcriptional regulator n=1 Tax=Kribbella sp. NPDC048915 TaxID=3155148 RepID=UPI0033E92939